MTFLEKVKKDNPNIKLKDSGAPMACPFELGYEEDYDCEEVKCIDCWNREMPNTEVKEEIFNYADGYDKGLNDAWELAKKLELNEVDGGFSNDKIAKTFGCTVYSVFEIFTPQEAIAKLKAYEEAQEKKDNVMEQIAELKLKIEQLEKDYVSKD